MNPGQGLFGATSAPASIARRAFWGAGVALALIVLIASPVIADDPSIWCGQPMPPPPPPPDNPCPTSPDSCPCERSPCSVATLNYTFAVSDIRLAAPGLPVELVRAYNSRRFLDGPLGVGWFPKYGVALRASTRVFDSQAQNWRQDVYALWGDTRRTIFRVTYANQFNTDPTSVYRASGVPGELTYDSATLTWRARPERATEIYTYDFFFNPLSVQSIDATGFSTLYTFDGNGRLTQVRNSLASSRSLTLAYGANGRISSVSDPTGRSVIYTYDVDGYLTAVSNPLGQNTNYTYTSGPIRGTKPISQITDHWGRVVTDVTYAPGSSYVKTYTENGETYTYTPLANMQTSKKDSSNREWIYTYDEGGRVTAERDPAGNTRTIGYDSLGHTTGVIDEVGVWNSLLYNSNDPYYTLNRDTRDVNGPQEVRFDYLYDTNFPEKPISITARKPDETLDLNWQSWAYEYWPPGAAGAGQVRYVYRVRTDGVTRDLLATYTYTAAGLVSSVQSAVGALTTYGYNGSGDLVSVSHPPNADGGGVRTYLYGRDALGRATSVTNPLGFITTYGYDALDRVTSVTLPKPSPGSPLTFITTYSYDNYDTGTGLLFTNITDPNGRITKSGYDQYGQVATTIDALNGATTYSYTGGLLTSITDANGNVTTYQYDSSRRLYSSTFPDGAIERYTYTADNLLYQKINRKNETISHYYDRLKRLTQRIYPNSTSIAFTFQGQQPTQIVDTSVMPSETHLFSYDSSYRVSSVTEAGRGTVNYLYNADDTVQNLSVQSGPSTTYTYYQDGSLNTIVWSPVSGQFKYRYTLPGQYQSVTFPSGATRNFAYDDQGRLANLTNLTSGGVNRATYAYGYDYNWATGQNTMLGQRSSMTATVPSQSLNNHLFKYEYDPLYELSKATYPNVAPFSGEVDSWTYDAIGNRTSQTINAATTNYTYQKIGTNPLNWQRLLNDGVNTYTYDSNGNTLTKGSSTFTWIYDDRLAGITGTASYAYDYQGRRASKTVGASTSTYLYDGLNLIRETGATPAEYLFGPGIDEPLAMSRSGSTYYYAVDGLGSVNLVTNAGGAVQNKYLYDAWGVTRSSTTPVANPFGYTSREFGEAGMLYYRARYYSPSIGRFLQEDPLPRELAQFTGEPYRYVLNAPLLHTDPLGLECTTNVYRGAPEEYRPRETFDLGWIVKPLNYPLRAAPPVVTWCYYTKIIQWTKFLRQLVSVVVRCTCPPREFRITEWSLFTESGSDIFHRDRYVLFPDRCPRDPDALFP